MMVQSDMNTAIKEYWEHPETISIIDKNLHRLEIDTVCRYLMPGDHLADIGCGDGEATVQYATKVKKCTAIERSNRLRDKAKQAAARTGVKNLEVTAGDVMNLTCPSNEFDAVVTQRVLINLASWEEQQQAIQNVHRVLKVGGRYIMIENTNDAFAALNDLRAQVGLTPVPQHWHNRFFDHDEMREFMRGRLQLLRHHDFGLYYFLSRVFVPMFASFVGYGAKAVKDPIYEKADEAARQCYEKFAKLVHVDGCRALGPIQVFVYRREA
jgi:ubiquinone/menaquinone biosynthesis C-methylase UbiE